MRDGFLTPAAVCLCVVVETVLALHGMSSNGPHSLPFPICGSLLWGRPSRIMERTLDGKTKKHGVYHSLTRRRVWASSEESSHWQFSVNSVVLSGPSVHPHPAFLKPREVVKS